MKLGFPLKNEIELAHDFAHSNLIGIVDLQTGKRDYLPISEDIDGEKKIFDSLVKNNLNNVISPFYTFLSLRVFKENQINTYKAVSGLLEANISYYQSGKMRPFDIYEALLTGECAKDCLSCSPEEACESKN